MAVSNLHKNTLKSFSETCGPVPACAALCLCFYAPCACFFGLLTYLARTCAVCSVKLMAAHVNPKNGEAASLIAEDVAEIVAKVCVLRCVLLSL